MISHLYTKDKGKDKEIQIIEMYLRQTRKKADFQRIQCVLLRLKLRMKATEVSQITGYKPGTVRKIWSLYKRKGINTLLCKEKGGRKNSHMTIDEEKLLLSPYFQKAESDGKLDIESLKKSFEKIIGNNVPKSTIYRLLKRHGWRKRHILIAPESRNKSNTAEELHDYWIQGCTQAIIPKKTGNISQQWLNNTLNSIAGS